MRSSKSAGFWTLVALVALTFASSPSYAQGSWGSWGSSHGSWGSRGGYGCCGGLFGGRRPVRNLLGRIGNRLFNGSRGFGSCGYASSGGYYGSCGYSSVGGSYGSWGGRYIGGSTGYSTANYTSGYYTPMATTHVSHYTPSVISNNCTTCSMSSGVIYQGTTPMMGGFPADGTPVQGGVIPNYYETPVEGGGFGTEGAVPSVPDGVPTPTGEPDVGAEDGSTTGIDKANESVLALDVPVEAVVYINGQRTRTTGMKRRYVASQMDPEKEYRYDIEVQIEKNGRTVTKKDSIVLQPGFEHRLAFDFKPVTTVLTVDVPKGAQVELSGVKTKSRGARRTFSTRDLVEGESWKDYTVKVQYEKNGKLLTKSRKINIEAGQKRHLIFDFDSTRVAAK